MMTSAMARFFSAGVVVALVVLLAKLAIAPVHGVRNAADCARAYADARSRTDTIAADLLSFPDGRSRRISHRCGERRQTNQRTLSVTGT